MKGQQGLPRFLLGDVGVDHRGLGAGVAQLLLDNSNVGAAIDEVSGVTVPQRMNRHAPDLSLSPENHATGRRAREFGLPLLFPGKVETPTGARFRSLLQAAQNAPPHPSIRRAGAGSRVFPGKHQPATPPQSTACNLPSGNCESPY